MSTAASNNMTPQTTCTDEPDAQPTYCALNVLPELSRYPFNPETYPLVDRQLLFWHWVAESYVKDGSTSRNAELRCPLLWCRKPFGKSNDLLQHVIVCSRLKDGEYWCPKHQAPERFSWPNSEEPPTNSKPFSGIHKAFKLLCELRMVSLITPLLPVLISRRRQHSLRKRSSAYELEQKNSPATTSNYLVSPSSVSVPALSDTQISEFTNTATTSPLTLATRSLDPRSQWAQPNPSHDQNDYSKAHMQNHFNAVNNELALSQASMSGASSLHQQGGTLDAAHAQNLANRLYSGQDLNYDATYGMGYGINDVNNMDNLPLNTTEMLLGHMSAGEDPGQYDLATAPGKLGLSYPEYSNSHTAFSDIEDSLAQRSTFENILQGIRIGNHFLPLQSPGNWNTLGSFEQPNATFNDSNRLNQSMLAQSVCDVSLIIFKQFENQNPRQEMSDNIKAWVDGSRGFIPRPETLLQHGLASLQGVLRGQLPTTAVDVNPVVYLAFVAALVIDEAGTDELAKDMADGTQQWGALITCKEERDQFLEVQNQGALSMRSGTSQPVEAEIPIDRGKKRSRVSEDNGAASKFKRTSTKLVPHTRFPSPQETPSVDKILAGRVAQICLLLLDIVEYSNRLALAGDPVDSHQDMNWPPEPLLSQPILLSVTTKLDEMQGIEGFKPVINSVASYIRTATSGLPLREVELKLIFDGWHVSQDRVAFRYFVSTVRQICKEISENPMLHPMPRDLQYTRAIDVLSRLLATQSGSGSVTIDSTQPNQNITSRPEFAKPIKVHHESVSSIPTPMSTTQTSSDIQSNVGPEPSVRRDSSTSYSRSNAAPGQTQPTPIKKESSKTREQPSAASSSSQANSQVADSGSLVCGICDQKFTGQKKNLKSNLKRHMKTIHPTEEDTVLCPICRTRFNNRTDNLLAHQRNVHGIFN